MSCATDECGKAFKMLEAWKILRFHPEYMPEINKTASPPIVNGDTDAENLGIPVHPVIANNVAWSIM